MLPPDPLWQSLIESARRFADARCPRNKSVKVIIRSSDCEEPTIISVPPCVSPETANEVLTERERRQVPIAEEDAPTLRHGSGFRSVNWRGQVLSFTEIQARVIKRLWRSYEDQTFDVSDQELIEVADCDSTRLSIIFRNNPAWGTLIIEGGTRGTHRLDA